MLISHGCILGIRVVCTEGTEGLQSCIWTKSQLFVITGSSEISNACDCWDVLDCSPLLGNPNCLQTTSASLLSQRSSHTLPQELLKHTSTRPSRSVRPPTSLTSVLLQTRSEKHKSVHNLSISRQFDSQHLSPKPKTNPSTDCFQYRMWYTGSDIISGIAWCYGSDIYIYAPDG